MARRRRTLEAYGVDIRQARRWRSLGLSPPEAGDRRVERRGRVGACAPPRPSRHRSRAGHAVRKHRVAVAIVSAEDVRSERRYRQTLHRRGGRATRGRPGDLRTPHLRAEPPIVGDPALAFEADQAALERLDARSSSARDVGVVGTRRERSKMEVVAKRQIDGNGRSLAPE